MIEWGSSLRKEMWLTLFHTFTLTCKLNKLIKIEERQGGRKKIKNRGDKKRSGQLVVGCLRLSASHPQAQTWSNTVASQPPDGPCPLAVYCCCDICHNNQVAFVWTLHFGTCLLVKINVDFTSQRNILWYYLINPKSNWKCWFFLGMSKHFMYSTFLSTKCIHEIFLWLEEMWHLTV